MFLTTNVYIPYDVGILANGRDEMLRSIGMATNVGLTVFGFMGGVFLAIMIIRKFIK